MPAMYTEHIVPDRAPCSPRRRAVLPSFVLQKPDNISSGKHGNGEPKTAHTCTEHAASPSQPWNERCSRPSSGSGPLTRSNQHATPNSIERLRDAQLHPEATLVQASSAVIMLYWEVSLCRRPLCRLPNILLPMLHSLPHDQCSPDLPKP